MIDRKVAMIDSQSIEATERRGRTQVESGNLGKESGVCRRTEFEQSAKVSLRSDSTLGLPVC
jgi:hypothetical protein